MVGRLRTVWEIIRIFREGESIGDVAVLKLTLFANKEGLSRYTADVLEHREQNFVPLDPVELAVLPTDTFGYAYARFMERNRLRPFNFSDRVKDLFARYPVSIRYIRLHDMFHVLLDFETDIAGELGVYAFVGEQKYNRMLDRAAAFAKLFARLMFWSRGDLRAAEQRGIALAATADILIAAQLESMLNRPLDEVRRKLRLAGVTARAS